MIEPNLLLLQLLPASLLECPILTLGCNTLKYRRAIGRVCLGGFESGSVVGLTNHIVFKSGNAEVVVRGFLLCQMGLALLFFCPHLL